MSRTSLTVIPAEPGWRMSANYSVLAADGPDDIRFVPVVAWVVHVAADADMYPRHRYAEPVSIDGPAPDNFLLCAPDGQCWDTNQMGPMTLADAYETSLADILGDKA